jgi:hypothetical protein
MNWDVTNGLNSGGLDGVQLLDCIVIRDTVSYPGYAQRGIVLARVFQ